MLRTGRRVSRSDALSLIALSVVVAFGVMARPAAAQTPTDATPAARTARALSDAEMERFLLGAKVVKTKTAAKGVTNSTQATLSDGTLTHDAHIQTVDEFKREFRSERGIEFDFRDSWSFNVAAYKLDRLIGLDMVPVSVSRSHRSARAAVTWWVDDVMMDEGGRLKKNLEAPPELAKYWYQQAYMMRMFDQLIYNTDRNLGNMLIAKDWRLWAIDHTRAFRKHTTLKTPGHVTRCERQMFEKMKALTFDLLKRELSPYLDEGQIKAILTRRDLIVARIESLGPTALFDRVDPTTAH
jgi:hypothetical protein